MQEGKEEEASEGVGKNAFAGSCLNIGIRDQLSLTADMTPGLGTLMLPIL
jgi:hypothetical protein